MTAGWIKFLDSKIFNWIFNATIAILTVILAQGMISRREVSKSIKDQIEARPTTEQVNEKISTIGTKVDGLKSYVDSQDKSLENILRQHIEESKRADEILLEYTKSIDANVRELVKNKKQ